MKYSTPKQDSMREPFIATRLFDKIDQLAWILWHAKARISRRDEKVFTPEDPSRRVLAIERLDGRSVIAIDRSDSRALEIAEEQHEGNISYHGVLI